MDTTSPGSRRLPRVAWRATVVVALLVTAGSCVPEAVVDVVTRVFPQGGLDRAVRIEGRDGEGAVPEGPDWLSSTLSVGFARPEAWSVTETAPGVVEAEAYFREASEVPPTLAHDLDDGRTVVDRNSVRLDLDDLVVLRRWRYVETWGDPFGPTDATDAVDRILAVLARVLRDDVAADLGPGIDLGGVDRVLAGPVRLAALEALQVERRFAATPDPDSRDRAMASVLGRAGVAPARSDADDFWEAQWALVFEELARRLAVELSTPDRPVQPDELGFLRAADERYRWFEAAAERTYGSMDALQEKVEPLFAALQGGYGGSVRTRFRFRARVELPGRLIRTNGTPDGGAAVWAFRGETLLAGDRVLSATSIETDGERLRALGALPSFEIADLLQIEDLLATGEVGRGLRTVLLKAVEDGSLDGLRDADALPDALRTPARELADLLQGRAPGSSD